MEIWQYIEETAKKVCERYNYQEIRTPIFEHTVNLMKKKRAEREEYLSDVMERVDDDLKTVFIEAEISGRPKHIYRFRFYRDRSP